MNNINLIYQKLSTENTSLPFLYPPLYIEDKTDYICFCTSSNISSKFWKIYQIDDFSSPNIQKVLNLYQNVKEILPNQLLTGPVFNNNAKLKLPSFITIPSFYDLTNLFYDEKLFVPTKNASGNYIFKKNPVYTNGIYNGRPLLLTIGVPVSNQIQTIDKCLSHIKPILEQLDAELLVVDTGSTDGTIEVCKTYHARIISFPWCNNMSAARNEAIYHALGLWYLSIDDDEWFENPDEIIQFFKSGLYQFYDAASYIQRNYFQSSGETYSDHQTVRMARITPELHFEGRIHDALILPIANQQYQLSCYAHHYGFIHSKKNKLNKYQRNASLLLYDIYEYPDNLRYNYQLAKEFHVMGYYREAFAYYLRGISIGREYPNEYHEKDHVIHLFSLLAEQKSELLFPFIDLLLKSSYPFTISDSAFISYTQADIGIQLDRSPDEILLYIQSYKKYYNLHLQSPNFDVIRTSTSIDVCNDIKYITNMHVIAFCIYCKKMNENAALTELEFIQPKYILFLKRIFCCHFVKSSASIYNKVIKKLSSSDFANWSNDILYAFSQSFNEATINNTYFLRLCEILPYYTISSLDQYLTSAFEEDISPEAQSYLSNTILSLELTDNITLQELYFFSCVLYKAIGHASDSNDNYFVFQRYVSLARKFVESYYHPDLLKPTSAFVIPPKFLAAYYTDYAINHNKNVIKNLEIAVSICPEFKENIDNFLNNFSVPITSNQDFNDLITQLKKNISTLISLNKREEAYQLLSEFQSICPNNNKINELWEFISPK